MNQNDIAVLMGLSRPKISRMLKMARDKRIVQFQITTPESHYIKLQEKIASAFALKKVLVSPTETSSENTKMGVCKTAADHLSSIIKDGESLGIVWGSTTSGMIQFLQERRLKGAKVYQLCGGLTSQHLYLDGHETTKQLAQALHAKHYVLNSPFMVNSGLMKNLLLQEPEIKNHFMAFKNIDIAVVGMGSSDPANSLPYLADYITLKESVELIEKGFAADVVGYRLNEDGTMADIPQNERVISIGLETLKSIPNVIAVACGEDKVMSIIAAARGKYINTLVIDEIAAIAIINKLALR
jgi:DNA-binding transcriptional regulator LsrR (DeoR family)